MESSNEQSEIYFKKALAAFKLGEIYEANVQIRRAIEINPTDEYIHLAKEIKSVIGQKSLTKAQQFFTNQQWDEALEEALKAEVNLPENQLQEAIALIQNIQGKLNSKSKKNKWITRFLVTGIATGFIFGAWYLYSYNNELQRWQNAKTQDNLRAYQDFLSSFPHGNYSILARSRMKEISEQDDQLWIQAITYPNSNTLSNYITTMEAHGGTHLEEAFYMLDSVEFNLAARIGSQESLNSYIQTHPQGNFIESAKQMLRTLVTPEEKIELLAYMKTFYELFQSGAYSELLKYFNPVTPLFVNKANISKADLLTVFESSKNEDVIREEILFDDSSVVVTKNAEGIVSMSFILDSKREIKGAYTGEKGFFGTRKRGPSTQQYANQEIAIQMDDKKKITHYKVKLLSTRKTESTD